MDNEDTIPAPEHLEIPGDKWLSEKEIVKDVVLNIRPFLRNFGIKRVEKVETERSISPLMLEGYGMPFTVKGVPKIDIFVTHEFGWTIIEVKRFKDDRHLINGIAQLMQYKTLVTNHTGISPDNVKLILLSNKMTSIPLRIVESFNLPIHSCVWGNETMALWKKLKN